MHGFTGTCCLETIKNLLQGLLHICVYQDDILITGWLQQEDQRNLARNRPVCDSREKKCTYLPPVRNSLELFQKPSNPSKKLHELKPFLGLVSYGKFLSNEKPPYSTLVQPIIQRMSLGSAKGCT